MEYGIQMFSVKDVAKDDLYAALKAVVDIGYKLIEFAGFFGHDAREVRSWLDELGLKVVVTHTGLVALTPDTIAATVEYHKIIGCDNIIIPNAKWATEELLESNIEAMRFAQSYLEKEGISLGFHNHSFELHNYPYGKMPMTEIIRRTELHLEPDIFWLYNAGVDPVTFLEENKSRIRMLHLKDGAVPKDITRDYSNPHEGAVGLSVGSGEAPIAEVYEWAKKNGVMMIVESGGYDPTGPDEVRRCIEHLYTLEK